MITTKVDATSDPNPPAIINAGVLSTELRGVTPLFPRDQTLSVNSAAVIMRGCSPSSVQ
jgi:hypothetical protein